MTSKVQDVRIFPGDESTKFRLLERTIDTASDPAFTEDPPYILNSFNVPANGVDVTKWHSVTVTHTAQDYSQAGWVGCGVTFIPWRYYKPISPHLSATPPVVGLPSQGAWIADTEETIAIDAVTLGITQQKVYSTLNCDKMFFQITSVVATSEEEAIAGAQYMRQSVFGVTPRQDDGLSPTVVGAAGGGGGGGGTATIPDPVNTNTIQLAGNPIDLGAGNVGVGTQLVTIATDDVNLSAINTWLQIVAEWDATHDMPAGFDGVRIEAFASDSQPTAVSTNGDDTRIAASKHGELYDASHTYPTQSNRSEEIDPANQWYEFSTLAAITNGADGTYYYYIPMASYTRLDMQAVLSGGTGTIALTVEASIQADGTAPASLAYIDVTNMAYGSASFAASAMLIDNTQFFGAFSYVRVKIVAAATNTADWTIYIKKMWE